MTNQTNKTIAVLVVALASAVTAYGAEKPLNSAASNDADTVRIERAVHEYADKTQANQEMAASAAAANKVGDLLQDPKSPVLGNPQGDVAVVEFFDYACPFCKAAEPRLEKLIKDDKRVKLVIKEFPILSPESLVASRAALASVKQHKYEAFHQALMAYHGQLTAASIFATATDIGLDVDKLRADMDAPDVSDEILSNLILAHSLKISVTPGFIVNTHVLSGVSANTVTSKIDFPAEVAIARSGTK